jgi:ATP-dependent Clp protease ATP-binding subunit ClpC
MFELFTDQSRRVVVLSMEEARRLRRIHIGTEHVLLGLISEGEGLAVAVLRTLGISPLAVRCRVEEIVGQGTREPPELIPFTSQTRKAIVLSVREARDLGHDYIGTEHLLLGLIRQEDGVAAQVLVAVGADLIRTREQVTGLLAADQGAIGGRVARGGRPSGMAGVTADDPRLPGADVIAHDDRWEFHAGAAGPRTPQWWRRGLARPVRRRRA